MKHLFTILFLSLISSMGVAQVISAFPFNEDFESQATGSTSCTVNHTFTGNTWQNANDPLVAPPISVTQQTDWRTDVGGTPSSSTGPGIDHTLGTAAGKYIYVETSGCNNQSAELVSPYMDFTGLTAPQMSFWYHAYGATMGTMHVDAVVGSLGTWVNDVIPAFTDNIDLWQEGNVNLIAFAGTDSVRVRFRFISGTSFTSDVALDDISVFQPQPYDFDGLGFLPMSCGLGQQPVTVEYVHAGADPVLMGDSIVFNYTDGSNNFMETYYTPVAINPGDTVTYTFVGMPDFPMAGLYTLQVWTDYLADVSNGNDTLWMAFTAKPIIDTYPYLENFENGTGGFEAFNSTNGAISGTWEFGTPMKTVIQGAASGINAWVSGGLTGDYLNSDNSWVDGPCFDFTNIDSGAYVSMKVWWNAEFSWDGSNLQSSTDGGVTWTNIGNLGTGTNWYNDNTIVGNPGGSQIGWSGRVSTGNGSGGWVLARHAIPATLYGVPSVNFRITFGTDGSVVDDGFAFDDFAIGYEDTIEVAALPDYSGCGPLTLDYGSTPGFYNYKIVDPISSAVEGIGAQYNGQIVFNNTSNVDSTFYFILSYADASGNNSIADTVLITLNPSPYADLSDTLFCSGFAGSVDFIAPSNPNYTYVWNNGSTSNTATYTVPGPVELDMTHTVSGCTYTATAMIIEGVAVDLPATAVSCSGATVTLDAGAGFTDYLWSTTETTQTIDVAVAGTYDVTTTDSLGCITTDMVTVTENNPSTSITGSIDTLCNYNTVTLNGGAGFSGYSWSTGGTAATETVDGATLPLGANTITVTVTDADGCTATDNVVIIVDLCLGLAELNGVNMSIYPNPSNGIFNYEISGMSGAMDLMVTDLSGKVVMSETVSAAGGIIDLTAYESGMYFVTLQVGDTGSTVRLVKK